MPNKSVYFNEYNIRMGSLSYLPLVSGLLRAHAETSEMVRREYTFKPFIYVNDAPQTILDRYNSPAVAAFSSFMWNEQLNHTIAREVKASWPECLIVFGGPQVPHHPMEYMKERPWIDVCVRAEGEVAFTEVLERFVETTDFSAIPGITWQGGENHGERPFSRDLDELPSPYLEGLYDTLVEGGDSFQAIIETNRGCPFHCTFCYWGKGGLSRKYKYFGLERIYRELEWCAKHKIKYIFNADSNFGMNKRDTEIADFLVDLKERTGFPDKFRTCYGKNTDEKIFAIGSLFHKHKLEKGITLARQSNDKTVLKNIKRGNISMDTYKNLQERFNHENIPIYSELILGLPGETVESWRNGIDELLRAGLKNQLFVYFCQVYPNTDLGDPGYQKEFGIVTQQVPLNEIHGTIHYEAFWVTEYEEIVVATDSMPTEDWRQMAILSWVTMLMHSLKLGYFVMEWMHDEHDVPHIEFLEYLATGLGDGPIAREIAIFNATLDDMLVGKGRGCVIDDCGNTYWDIEEASFIRCMRSPHDFYWEDLYFQVKMFLFDYWRKNGFGERSKIKRSLSEVIEYQKSRIPTIEMFDGNVERWARETILWGRKSGTMLVPE
jgi:putative methyltransferase